MTSSRKLALLTAALALLSSASAQTIQFDFGAGKTTTGWTKVTPDLLYSESRGFGFENVSEKGLTAFDGGTDPVKGDGVTSVAPFFFSFKVPTEGNWRVTVTLGEPSSATMTTISAEIRRLMVLHAETKAGETKEVTFIVNTRTPTIPGGKVVRLKPRETQGEAIAWDDRITLEFNDAHPAIAALTAERVENLPTFYLMGDSTMTDQPGMPTTSWGQFFPYFFKNTVAIANHGESGEAYSASRGELRLAKVLSLIKPGDWVLTQFGHNDEKERERGPAFGAFKNYLDEIRIYAKEIQGKGAHLILVTPMQRHEFADGRVRNTHDDYPDAVRVAAKELNLPMIDLTAMSDQLMNAMGDERSWLLFSRGKDATHHSPFGAWELAKCVVQGLKEAKVEPAKWLRDGLPEFDPAKPDSFESYTVPDSPGYKMAGRGANADDPSKPYGR